MTVCRFGRLVAGALLGCGVVTGTWAEESTPVSFSREVMPIFTASCNGCHQPEKKKGGLDLTTHAGVMKGGDEGAAIVKGDPAKSNLIVQVSGDEPAMPAKGDKLSSTQIEVLKRWIEQGAKDDTPVVAAGPVVAGAGTPGPAPIDKPPVYGAPPVITSIAFSPDGQILAVSGYQEVVLHRPDGSGMIGRLLSGTPRIESIAFSKDGTLLAASGGQPAMFGHVQIWDVESKQQKGNFKIARDAVFGISFSPDGGRIAVGCTDKSARVMRVSDGGEIARLDQHTDWCLQTTFTQDGKRLLTGGRDKGMKLTDLAHSQFIDDINNPLEAVLSMAKHPKEDVVVYGGDMGTPRIYKISDNQNRTAARNDTNLMRTIDKQPGAVHAVAWSGDGALVACGSVGEVRVYDAKTGAKVATCGGISGAVFAVAFHPVEKVIAAGGYDGKVRLFDGGDGKLIKEFVPVQVGLSVAGK